MSVDPDYHRDQGTAREIEAHLCACDAAFVPMLSTRVNLADYAAKLISGGTRFEAWASGELVGLIVAYCNRPESGIAFITTVSVLPNWQGRGLADYLIKMSVDHAASSGYSRLDLRVSVVNFPALRLYARNSFAMVGLDGEEMILRRDLGALEGD